MPRPKREGASIRSTFAKTLGMLRIKYRIYPRGDCWEWRGAKTGDGYGAILNAGTCKMVQVHRAAYEIAKGAIPPGLVIDHICRHKWCVRPSHLEAVPHWLNTERARNVRELKDVCGRGHSMADARVNPLQPNDRQCRVCANARAARHRMRMRAKRAASANAAP